MTTIVTIGSGDAVVGHDKDSIGVHVTSVRGQPNEAIVISFAGAWKSHLRSDGKSSWPQTG